MKDKKFRALLLAAGFGTRLKPLTDTTPKCLIEVENKPLLHSWLDKLENLQIESVLINTHYLPTKVNQSIQNWKGKNLNIYTSYENNLLGTAGTLLKNLDFFRGSKGLIIHADNATKDDLSDFIKAHECRPKDALITMLTFETDNPEQCGVVKLDKINMVKDFYEKVSNPPSTLANGAIYAFDDDFIEFLKEISFSPVDISRDLIPALNGRIYSYKTNSTFIDIGTHINLQKARESWK